MLFYLWCYNVIKAWVDVGVVLVNQNEWDNACKVCGENMTTASS